MLPPPDVNPVDTKDIKTISAVDTKDAGLVPASDSNLHSSRHVRALLIFVGTVCLVTGLIGIVVPLLPTTPFLLLAAACYARSSERFYEKLVTNRYFGPPILQWRRTHTVSGKNKRNAVLIIIATFSTTMTFGVDKTYLRVILACTALILIALILRLPSQNTKKPDKI